METADFGQDQNGKRIFAVVFWPIPRAEGDAVDAAAADLERFLVAWGEDQTLASRRGTDGASKFGRHSRPCLLH